MTTAVTNANGAATEDAVCAAKRLPLVIDVDGTLLHADITLESLTAYVKSGSLHLFQVAGWAFKGRGYLKRQLADRVTVDIETMPVNARVVAIAEEAANAGRAVYLATASDAKLVSWLKTRFPFLTDILASDGTTNLKGNVKAKLLAARFPQGFEYAGNSSADISVWKRASAAIVVNAPRSVTRRARQVANVIEVIPPPRLAKPLLQSLRLHQMAKNLLVFAPIILGGELDSLPAVLATLAAFVALCFVTASTYVINDILDVAQDRVHWSKRFRPIAAGALLPGDVIGTAAVGLFTGFMIAAALSWEAVGIMAAYLVLTLAYSMALKRAPLVDGVVLATLFTFRLAIGVVASDVPPSPWLFVFSMFIFTSLSYAKRYTELKRVIEKNGTSISGRCYRLEDAPLVLALGVASGLAAVIITIFYIIDDAFLKSFYGRTVWLWGFPPLVFLFICRAWLISVRGEMADDPVEFALKDSHCRILLVLLLVCFTFAWLG
jgi:4-hydroxybenzoate polyprenyltransferase